jgi:hypothetical protein
MLWHWLWLEFIAYALIVGGVRFALRRLGLDEGAGLGVALLLAVLVGVEASSLLRWKLARRGFDNLGVVVGEDLEDAERRFFDGWTDAPSRPAPVASPAASPFAPPLAQLSSDIVGLFPQPEARS